MIFEWKIPELQKHTSNNRKIGLSGNDKRIFSTIIKCATSATGNFYSECKY